MDNVQFKHKNITNLSLMYTDKIIRALSHCIKALTGKEATTTEQELRDIRKLIDVTQANLQSNKTALPMVQTQTQPTEQFTQQTLAVPRGHTNTVRRVPATEDSTE